MSARGCRDEAVRAPQPAAVPDQPGGGGPGLGGHTPGGVGQVSGPTLYSSLCITYCSVRDLLRHETFRSGLPELAICLVLRDLCHALDYLHHQGVVHRAVRASHILGEDLLIIGVNIFHLHIL